jgi:hypothetical protein
MSDFCAVCIKPVANAADHQICIERMEHQHNYCYVEMATEPCVGRQPIICSGDGRHQSHTTHTLHQGERICFRSVKCSIYRIIDCTEMIPTIRIKAMFLKKADGTRAVMEDCIL